MRVGFLQLLCLEKLYKEAYKGNKGDKDVNTIDGIEIFSLDKIESFQNKKWF